MSERARLAEVASLYYEDGFTQAEIADRIGTSRSTVSRLLDEARDKGVVEITVHYLWKTSLHLEGTLTSRFNLSRARVLVAAERSYEDILRGIGVLAARYLRDAVEEGTVLGISWGTAIRSTVRALEPKREFPITVVQMIGATGANDPGTDGPDLARALADLYGGQYHSLHAPLLVEDSRVREALLEERHIRRTLGLARRADIALVGIGTTDPELSSFLRAGYLGREDLRDLREQGAVGDICGWHYDIHGRVLQIPMNGRVVGIRLDELDEVRTVVGVAAGEPKVEAVYGALRGQHLDVLVTDDATANGVLAMDRRGV
jgi:DNA-binding transcriptional regulator LsrR (DeoR family)